MNESINHYGGIRVRILNGVGTLVPTLYNLDGSVTFTPVPINMNILKGFEQHRLANLKSERCRIRLETNNKDDYFEVTRILLYYKPLWSNYPQ